MLKHLLHVTPIYKLGHLRFTVKAAIIGRNINRIEHVPADAPEFVEGALTRIQLPTGEWLGVTEPYEEVVAEWEKTLESL